MNVDKKERMIESDSFSFEMWKLGAGIGIFNLKNIILIWLIIMPILLIIFKDFSWNFLIIYSIVLLIYLLVRYTRKNVNSKIYLAKMNADVIILKRDGEDSIEMSWNEIASISRLRFTNPALYIMTPIKPKADEYIFPTSSHLLTFSIGINGFGIQRDFSRMGKHIRKMKHQKNIESFYILKTKFLITKIKKTFANTS